MKQLLIKFKHLKFDQKIIVLLSLLISLPFYLMVPITIGLFLYLLVKGKFRETINFLKSNFVIPIMMTLYIIVSLFYGNYPGALFTFCFYLIIFVANYYYRNIDQETFELITSILIFSSVLWAIYGAYEEYQILTRLDKPLSLHVFTRRENRINSVFMNANYYATMIEFIILIITYKFFKTNLLKQRIIYIIIGLVNLIALYYTGCRTGVLALAIALAAFFIINKNYKVIMAGIIFTIPIISCYALNLDKIPRIDFLSSDMQRRLSIYETAIAGIKRHPLLGQGSYTYLFSLNQFPGYDTQHAHNMYLEYLMNFGFIGLIIPIIYIPKYLKKLKTILTKDILFSSLIISTIVVIVVHGLIDVTILWFHTILVFSMIVFALPIIHNTGENNE